MRVELSPDAAARRWRLQPGSAVAQERGAPRGVQRNVAAAFEEGMTKYAVEPLSLLLELLKGQVGDDEAHAAADVGSGTARHHKAMGIDDGADGDSGALVEVRRQHATTDRRLEIPEEALA